MNVQTSGAYNPISGNGCYFLALLFKAEQYIGRPLSPESVLNIYAEAVCSGAMRSNCYVLAPHTIVNLGFYELAGAKGEPYHGPKCEYIGWWNDDMDGPEMWKDNLPTFAILRYTTKYGYHFLTEDYNPDPRLDLLSLSGKRFFRIYR